eukprot:UN33485
MDIQKEEKPDKEFDFSLADENLINSGFHNCENLLSVRMKTYLEMEKRGTAVFSNIDYFKTHDDIHPEFRTKLFFWIARVHEKAKLAEEVLFLAVNLFDRYMTKIDSKVKRSVLQLIGSVCLWIASKHHDVRQLSGKNIVSLVDGAFEYTDLLDKEGEILEALNFIVIVPISHIYLQWYLLLVRHHPEFQHIKDTAHYLDEVLLLNVEYITHAPSSRASIAFYW